MKTQPPKGVRIGSSVSSGKNTGAYIRGRQSIKM
nr:MAG TPA: hypothetical protein [Caudoviricetes sp.]